MGFNAAILRRRRRAGGAASLLEQVLDGRNGFAVDFRDGSMLVNDTVTPANAFAGGWRDKWTITGTLTEGANGVRLTGSNHAELATSAFPYSQTESTVLVLVNAENTDTNTGSATIANGIAGLYESATNSSAFHYASIGKNDLGTGNARMVLNTRNELGTAAAFTSAQDGSFPAGEWGVVGASFSSAGRVLANSLGDTTVNSAAAYDYPDGFLKFFLGTQFNTIYADVRGVMYLPVKQSSAELAAEIAAFAEAFA